MMGDRRDERNERRGRELGKIQSTLTGLCNDIKKLMKETRQIPQISTRLSVMETKMENLQNDFNGIKKGMVKDMEKNQEKISDLESNQAKHWTYIKITWAIITAAGTLAIGAALKLWEKIIK